ncbi:hypothetical protein M3Y97_00650400 [Aphelenchoides bicaudatus]|nr:hypothetical protein M3Y97_00650400 [Aphelenchoides bicaudatus]
MATPVTSIEACSTTNEDQKSHSIHILPAQLDYTGQSNVSSFFPQRCDSDDWTSFRGHAIQPFKIETPSGFQLNVVKKKDDSKDYIVEGNKKSCNILGT